MYLYNRSKNCAVKLVDDTLYVDTVFIDDVHEMVLNMIIGIEDKVIRDINFSMMRAPHDCCKNVQNKAIEMKGMTVSQGISKVAKERFGDSTGCYHLLDLFLEGIKVYKQGYTRLLLKNNDIKSIEASRKRMKDTCYYFTEINKTK